jgi:hypothetical protein
MGAWRRLLSSECVMLTTEIPFPIEHIELNVDDCRTVERVPRTATPTSA